MHPSGLKKLYTRFSPYFFYNSTTDCATDSPPTMYVYVFRGYLDKWNGVGNKNRGYRSRILLVYHFPGIHKYSRACTLSADRKYRDSAVGHAITWLMISITGFLLLFRRVKHSDSMYVSHAQRTYLYLFQDKREHHEIPVFGVLQLFVQGELVRWLAGERRRSREQHR